MSNNNNGLFDKIRQTMAVSQGQDAQPQVPAQTNSKQGEPALVEKMQQQLEKETQKITKALEAKYKQQSLAYVQEQEANLKRLLKHEKEQYEKYLKDKYERIARAALRDREQQLLKQVQQKINTAKTQEAAQSEYSQRQRQLSDAEWQLRLDRLQQELQQHKNKYKLDIEAAIIQARKEQENALTAEFEHKLNSQRCDITKSIEQKYSQQLEMQAQTNAQQLELLEQSIQHRLNKQAAQLTAEYEQKIMSINAEKDQQITNAIAAKEQELKQLYLSKIEEQAETAQIKHEHEITLAVSAAIAEREQTLRKEFAQQQQQLNSQTLQMQEEYAQNIQKLVLSHNTKIAELDAELLRVNSNLDISKQDYILQLEKDLQAKYAEEFAVKLENEKHAIAMAKERELEQQINEQRKQIKAQLENENVIVLKYKERDLETSSAARLAQSQTQFEQELRSKLQEEFATKEQIIQAEFEAKYQLRVQELQQSSQQEILEAKMTADYSSKQQAILAARIEKLEAEIEAERVASQSKQIEDTKALLQQQHKTLTEQYTIDLKSRLTQLAEQKALEQQQALTELEQRLHDKYTAQFAEMYVGDSDPESALQQSYAQALEIKCSELNAAHELDKMTALRQLEESLRAEFSMQISELQEQNRVINNMLAQTNASQADYQDNHMLQQQLQDKLNTIEQNLRAQFKAERENLENTLKHEKQLALDKLKQELSMKHTHEIQKVHADLQFSKVKEIQEQDRKRRAELEDIVADRLTQQEAELRIEFHNQLAEQRKQLAAQMNAQMNATINEQIHQTIEQHKQQITEQLQIAHANELEMAEDQLKEQYTVKLQQHIDIIKADLEQERVQLQIEHQAQLEADRRELRINLESELESKFEQRFEQERNKLNQKLVQDRAALVKELTKRFNQEKEAAIAEHESNLRDSLYKEMVKQKEYIQTKCAMAQENALQELKRRLESQHKQEVERVKQGYFDAKERAEFTQTLATPKSKLAAHASERGMDHIAERILAKFGAKERE